MARRLLVGSIRPSITRPRSAEIITSGHPNRTRFCWHCLRCRCSDGGRAQFNASNPGPKRKRVGVCANELLRANTHALALGARIVRLALLSDGRRGKPFPLPPCKGGEFG